MANPKKYFHDRFILLMLTVNVFLTFVTIASTLLRLGDTGNDYIQAYRGNLGFNAYSVGGAEQIVSFAVFAVIVLVGQFIFSYKLHEVRKEVSWIITVLGMLLLILTLIVSNALLGLR